MNLRVQLKCKNLHEYLRELSPDILDKLYYHPSTCLAVYRYDGCAYTNVAILVTWSVVYVFILWLFFYREHPSTAKNYVIRMLFLDQPLPQAAVALWVNKDNQK